jgi:hypothetical protein
MKLFQALNPDAKLLAELYVMPPAPAPKVAADSHRAKNDDDDDDDDEARLRQMLLSEDVLAEELEKEVEMVTSLASNSNVPISDLSLISLSLAIY